MATYGALLQAKGVGEAGKRIQVVSKAEGITAFGSAIAQGIQVAIQQEDKKRAAQLETIAKDKEAAAEINTSAVGEHSRILAQNSYDELIDGFATEKTELISEPGLNIGFAAKNITDITELTQKKDDYIKVVNQAIVFDKKYEDMINTEVQNGGLGIYTTAGVNKVHNISAIIKNHPQLLDGTDFLTANGDLAKPEAWETFIKDGGNIEGTDITFTNINDVKAFLAVKQGDQVIPLNDINTIFSHLNPRQSVQPYHKMLGDDLGKTVVMTDISGTNVRGKTFDAESTSVNIKDLYERNSTEAEGNANYLTNQILQNKFSVNYEGSTSLNEDVKNTLTGIYDHIAENSITTAPTEFLNKEAYETFINTIDKSVKDNGTNYLTEVNNYFNAKLRNSTSDTETTNIETFLTTGYNGTSGLLAPWDKDMASKHGGNASFNNMVENATMKYMYRKALRNGNSQAFSQKTKTGTQTHVWERIPQNKEVIKGQVQTVGETKEVNYTVAHMQPINKEMGGFSEVGAEVGYENIAIVAYNWEGQPVDETKITAALKNPKDHLDFLKSIQHYRFTGVADTKKSSLFTDYNVKDFADHEEVLAALTSLSKTVGSNKNQAKNLLDQLNGFRYTFNKKIKHAIDVAEGKTKKKFDVNDYK